MLALVARPNPVMLSRCCVRGSSSPAQYARVRTSESEAATGGEEEHRTRPASQPASQLQPASQEWQHTNEMLELSPSTNQGHDNSLTAENQHK